MKQLYYFLLVILLNSCKYFNVKKTSSQSILQEELKTFNWDEIDQYPSFSLCDNFEIKEDKKNCFQEILNEDITNYLKKQRIIVTREINDTLMLELSISNKGDIVLVNTTINNSTLEQIPNLEKLLKDSLKELPQIHPAIKRGQQVATQFKLPLIINDY